MPKLFKNNVSSLKSGGREGIRTPGLLVANEKSAIDLLVDSC